MTEEEKPKLDTPLEKLSHRVNLDYQKLKLTEYFLSNNCYSFRIVETPINYYDMNLDERQKIVQTHSKSTLCKSIILENKNFDPSIKCDLYQKFYLTIVQYVSEFNTEKIGRTLKNYLNSKFNLKLANKHFHFRLCDNDLAFKMTGFTFNAIGPYLMKCKDLMILFPKSLYDVYPEYFFLGGGEYELKVGLTIDDFMKLLGKNTIVLDTAPDQKK
jgi:hypothetical protein